MAADVAALAIPHDAGDRPLAVVDVLVADAPQPESDDRRRIVVFLLAVAIFAPLIAPKDPTDGELADSLASPGQSTFSAPTRTAAISSAG